MRFIGQVAVFTAALFALAAVGVWIEKLTPFDGGHFAGFFSALTATAIWPSLSWGRQ